jgi:hypothetical protein
MLFKDILLEIYGHALSEKLKSGAKFTVDEVNEEAKAILLEVDFWTPYVKETPNGFYIEAEESDPKFGINFSKIEGKEGVYGVKFGEGENYSWETNRVLMIKKAEFLKRMARTIVRKKFIEGDINTLVFAPVASDGKDADRERLFKGLYSELTSGMPKDFLSYKDSDEEYSGSMTISHKQ